MKQLEFKQILPVTIKQAWSFFSSPKNLEVITPPDVNFSILSDLPDRIYPGLRINYEIRVLRFFRFYWTTEITEVTEEKYFADEQKSGPYKYWRHEHYFEQVGDDVLITDKLYYDIGRSFVGTIAGIIFVDQKVNSIFKFRRDALNMLFTRKT